MTAPGWRQFESAPQAAPDIVAALRSLAVSLLSDNIARAARWD